MAIRRHPQHSGNRRRRRFLRSGLLQRRHEEAPQPRPNNPVDDDLEASERAEQLRIALGELPTRQREVLILTFYQGLTVEAASEVMRISVGSARTHYHRGKQRLRELLADEHLS